MPNVLQRRVLFASSVLAVVGFAWQPKLDVLGNPVGFWAFWTNQLPGYSSGGTILPDYRMLATEAVALAFVTACLYLATSGGRE